MTNQSIEAQMETRDVRRCRAEDRYLDRMDKRWSDAEEMIGELCREGKKVYYVTLRRPGRPSRHKEGTRAELIDFVIRNNYV